MARGSAAGAAGGERPSRVRGPRTRRARTSRAAEGGWEGPCRPPFVSPAASAFSSAPVLLPKDARECRRAPHLRPAGCCRALRCPPKVPLLLLRSQKAPPEPAHRASYAPARPRRPNPARGASGGSRSPPPRPGGALPRRRALRAGSGVGVTSASRWLPVLAAVGSVRPGGSASQPPPQQPAAVAAAARFSGSGSDVTAGAGAGGWGTGGADASPLPPPRPAVRYPAVSPPRGYRVLSRREHLPLVRPCTRGRVL